MCGRAAHAGAAATPASRASRSDRPESWAWSWPQAASISRPRVSRTVTVTPPSRRIRDEALDARPAASRSSASPGVGLSGMRFTCERQPRASSASPVGLLVGVVEAVDHHVLEAHPPAGARREAPAGGDTSRDRPLAVDRHELVAQRIGRGVQADGEVDLRQLVDHAIHARHDARGADGDVARADPEPRRVVEQADRLEHAVGVVQRLAHAHEHDVVVARATRRPSAFHGGRCQCSTWSTISPGVSCRPKPAWPVAQNGQFTAHPACELMQIVVRSRTSHRAPGSA